MIIFATVGAVGVAVATVGARRRQLDRTFPRCADGDSSRSLGGLTRGFQFRQVRVRKARARSQNQTSRQEILPSRLRARSGSPTGTGRTARTWKEYAGRIHGGDGYHLGDLTRGRLRSLRAIRARARRPEALAREEVAAPVPERELGVNRDRTQDFKNLRLRHREESLAQAPKRKELRDMLVGEHPLELQQPPRAREERKELRDLQQFLKEGASVAGARREPQHPVFCSGVVHSEGGIEYQADTRCGKRLICDRRSVQDFLRWRARPVGAAGEEGKVCHICRQWFCPDCRPHLLRPQSVALLMGESNLGRLSSIKCCHACHCLVDTIRWQQESGLGTSLGETQQELAAAYRGLNDHRAKVLEALDHLEQSLRDVAELEDDNMLDDIALEEFTEIFQEGCREAESVHRYFDLARGILESIVVHSPLEEIVKEQMVTHFRNFREVCTARLHVAERSVKGFFERNK